jgi:imidazolonepropionase-like amidohydrolase
MTTSNTSVNSFARKTETLEMTAQSIHLHGNVWDAKQGFRPDRWIQVTESQIEGIYETKPQAEGPVYEVDFLIPGLIDMHVHYVWDGTVDPVKSLREQSRQETVVEAVQNARKTLSGGITTARDVGSTNDIAITIRDAIRSGKIPGPRTFASGQTIIISGGHDPFWGIESDGTNSVRAAVRQLRSNGANLIKVSATGGVYGQAKGEKPGASELSYEELAAIVDEADRFDLQVAAHAVGQEGIRNAVEAGVDTIEHGNLMDEETLALLVEKDIALDPTLYTYRNIALTDSIPAYAQENAQEVYESHAAVFENSLDREARILAGSDAGSPELPHPSLHRELACLVEFGQSSEEALVSATLRAAKQLENPDLGVIEPDTPADIVGYATDPRKDISVTGDPSLVMKDGTLYGRPRSF